MAFRYEILVGRRDSSPPGVSWFAASQMNNNLGPDLLRILNRLGQQDWEVVAVAPIAFDSSPEIILKRRVEANPE
jgi:hypothetical protein